MLLIFDNISKKSYENDFLEIVLYHTEKRFYLFLITYGWSESKACNCYFASPMKNTFYLQHFFQSR